MLRARCFRVRENLTIHHLTFISTMIRQRKKQAHTYELLSSKTQDENMSRDPLLSMLRLVSIVPSDRLVNGEFFIFETSTPDSVEHKPL